MKSLIVKIATVLFISSLLLSCQLVDDIFDNGQNEIPQLPTNKVKGEINLPKDSKLLTSDLNISSFGEEIKISAADTGKFEISVVETNKPQVLFVTNKNKELVLLGLADPIFENVEVSAVSTAKSLILINPVFIYTSAQQRNQILSDVKNHPDFNNLVSGIENLLMNDPENVLDINLHPKIYEYAAQISVDLLKEVEKFNEKSALSEKKTPWFESFNKHEVTVYNPRSIFFTAEYNPKINEINSHLIKSKSSLVSFDFAWPPVYYTEPTENIFKIPNDGTYQVEITKGFDFSNPGELFNYKTSNGKATLANTGKSISLLIDLILGFDLPIDGLLNLAIDGKKNLAIGIRMGNHFMDGDAMGIIYDVCDFSIENQDIILYWIRQELNPANGDNIDEILSQVFSVMKNVAVVTKVISIGSKAANQVIPFVYDLITVDRTIQYTLEIQNGYLQKSALNTPPLVLETELSKNEVLVNNTFTLKVKGEDSENDEIAFRVHWGDGNASDWSQFVKPASFCEFNYKYSMHGNYNIVVEVKDAKGSIGLLSDMIPITVFSQEEDFIYDFENDIIGTLPASPPWQTKQENPSYVRVSNQGFGGSLKSCEFVDFDPGILNNDEDGGVAVIILNNQLKNSGTVKFSCKVANKDDNFGIRAWQDDDFSWSEMGFYVSFRNGYLCYYIDGEFFEIMEFTVNEWYEFELNYNTSNKKYDIKINGVTVKQDVNYSGDPYKLSKLQILAFSNASCHRANIDNVSVPVEYTKNATINGILPIHATTISN